MLYQGWWVVQTSSKPQSGLCSHYLYHLLLRRIWLWPMLKLKLFSCCSRGFAHRVEAGTFIALALGCVDCYFHYYVVLGCSWLRPKIHQLNSLRVPRSYFWPPWSILIMYVGLALDNRCILNQFINLEFGPYLFDSFCIFTSGEGRLVAGSSLKNS